MEMPAQRRTGQGMTTSRMEAFSDGVFAIAITLLILNIGVPNSANGRLAHDLLAQWPSYAAYIASFLLIGIYWVNHHALVRKIARTDRGLLFTNLLFLMSIAFLPFPTAVLARFLRAGHDQQTAAAVYGLAAWLAALTFVAIWIYAARNKRLLREDLEDRESAVMTLQTLGGPVVYLAAIGVAFINPVAALVVYTLVPIFYILAGPGWGA